MRRTVQLILAGVVCLDLAYKSSVDAFLPAPTLLRGSLARQRSHVVASGQFRVATVVKSRRSVLLNAKALFGGPQEVHLVCKRIHSVRAKH
jgi:hypothetical protein